MPLRGVREQHRIRAMRAGLRDDSISGLLLTQPAARRHVHESFTHDLAVLTDFSRVPDGAHVRDRGIALTDVVLHDPGCGASAQDEDGEDQDQGVHCRAGLRLRKGRGCASS